MPTNFQTEGHRVSWSPLDSWACLLRLLGCHAGLFQVLFQDHMTMEIMARIAPSFGQPWTVILKTESLQLHDLSTKYCTKLNSAFSFRSPMRESLRWPFFCFKAYDLNQCSFFMLFWSFLLFCCCYSCLQVDHTELIGPLMFGRRP